MAKCEYKADYLGYSCDLTALDKEDFNGKKHCIFHNSRGDKDVYEFHKRFKELYLSGDHKFVGFVFPVRFDFRWLRREINPDENLKFIDAEFAWAHFLCNVDLSFAEFAGIGKTGFSYVKFNGDKITSFRKAKFLSELGTDFTFSEFSDIGLIDFSYAEFSGDGKTDFSITKFTGIGRISFFKTQFLCDGGTYFRGAEFKVDGGTDFRKAKFKSKGDTNFNGSIFSSVKGTDFREAEFDCHKVNFRDTQFLGCGEVKFENRTFFKKTKAYFAKVFFETPKKVSFEHIDLNRCRFIWTDLENIIFKEVFWKNQEYKEKHFEPKEIEEEKDIFNLVGFLKDCIILEIERIIKTIYGILKKKDNWNIKKWLNEIYKIITKRIMIYDEYFQTGYKCKKDREPYHYSVQQLYNQLRLNYERSGRYHEAGDFFVGAMEMRRKGTREKWIIRKALTFYKWISLYGERPVRALLWLIATPFLFLPFYFFNGVTTHAGIDPPHPINYDLVSSTANPAFWSDLGKTLYFSISNIWLGRTFTNLIPENGWTILFTILENITGVVLISLFILAMNRKFRRTKD